MNARSEFLLAPRASTAPGGAVAAPGLAGPHLALLLALAWAVIVIQLLVANWSITGETLRDTDDAMRLVEMRGFLAGHGWFDLHEARIAPPLGYDPHWSRLIDAGLAGLFLLFRQFTDAAMAERLMRVAWPLLWLVPAMAGITAIANRLAGREGALVALLFAVLGLPAFPQFVPGRIDHHNVQIALSLLALAATVWSDRVRWAAIAAGLSSGLAMAIGFECLPFLVVCGAALGLRFVFDPAAGRPLAAYGLSLAAGTAFAFAANVPPARWSETVCDAIALNSAAPVIAGGVLLAAVATTTAARTLAARLAAVLAVAAVVLIAYLGLEPRCVGGPFAMMDPAVWPIWLANVREMQSWVALAGSTPYVAAAIAIFPAFALVGACALAREPVLRRDLACLVAFAALVIACGLSLATIKMSSYAAWIAMPPAALVAVRLCTRLKLAGLVARATAAILLAPAVMSVTAAAVVEVAAPNASADRDWDAKAVCFKTASYAALARLPPGLVAAEIDYGPYLLALTPHAAIAGPYHRMSAAIIATQRIFASPPEEARPLLTHLGGTYIALCGPRGPRGLSEAAREASLWGRLRAGAVPDWLERLDTGADRSFAVYRVTPQG